MARVIIPASMQIYSAGQSVVEANGKNVRQLIEELETKCPGIGAALVEDGKLKPGVCAVVDGVVQQLGALASTKAAKEVVFMPIIGGG